MMFLMLRPFGVSRAWSKGLRPLADLTLKYLLESNLDYYRADTHD